MRIPVKELPLSRVLTLPPARHRLPKKPSPAVRALLKTLSAAELRETGFTWKPVGMERLSTESPCLVLMNHSCFLDLKIASTVLYPRPLNIVCTSDGFVGKAGLMRALGCIPTQKFASDPALVRDLLYTVRTLKSSILLYPEASYSFDGTATPLPDTLGKLLKLLKVPVVMIRTRGAFQRDPLYNGLQLRKVNVSAEVEYLLSPEEIAAKPVTELNAVLKAQFSFDQFRWQRETGIRVAEPFRADGLHRVLYKCPRCGTEGRTEGKGVSLTCHACNAVWTLTEDGALAPSEGDGVFDHVPDWYRWERECVRSALLDGTYRLETPVDICILRDEKAVYRVGDGVLTHTRAGFHLTGCGGELDYTRSPTASYSLYADYFWYEIGDMICIGEGDTLYYCFPKDTAVPVAKARLAAEELYSLVRSGALGDS